MPNIKIQTVVVGFLFDAHVWLEGEETKLSYDGDKTRKSTDVISVEDGELNIIFHGVGVAGTDWELTITELEPDEKQLYDRKGTIQSTGHSLVIDSVKL
jgi:hypothetical protein